MKKILFVCETYSECRAKFKKMIARCIDFGLEYEIRFSPMSVSTSDVEYLFVENSERIRGLKFDQVIFDELANISPEEKSILKSRQGV